MVPRLTCERLVKESRREGRREEGTEVELDFDASREGGLRNKGEEKSVI